MNRVFRKNVSFVIMVVFAFVVLAGGLTLGVNNAVQAATATLNPVADTDTHSDVAAGTNTVLNASQWCNAFFKFSLSSITGTVTDAKFRVYHQSHSVSHTLNLCNVSTDSWVEGGTKPTLGTVITSTAVSAVGYVEYNVTSLVNTQAQGDDFITFGLSTNIGTYETYTSREGTNKPQLVVTYGSTSTSTPTPRPATPTPAPAAGTIGNTVDGTSNDATGANYYNALRYQASSAMTVTQMRIKVATAGTGRMKCAIYSDNAGNVGSLLRATGERSALGAGWQTFGLTSSLALTSGTYYWLVSWRDGAYTISSTTAAACNRWGALTYAASFPATLPAYQGTADYRHSFYATGGATPTPGATSTPTATPRPATATPTPVSGGNMKIGTDFHFSYRGDPMTDPFLSNATFAVGSNPWRPEFLNEMAPYKVLRFMDWMCTNNNDTVNWSDRKQQTAQDQEGIWCDQDFEWVSGSTWRKKANPPVNIGEGIAYEWLIDLGNRLDKDIWINIPQHANDNYSQQMATLFKNTLETGRKIYLEFTNEAWNFTFDASHYFAEKGAAMGLPGDQYQQSYEYYAVRACQHFNIWKNIFTGADRNRLVFVLSGQSGNAWLAQIHMDMINNSTYNPSGVKPDAYATAPYIGHDYDGAASNIFTLLNNDIAGSKSSNLQVKNVINAAGIPRFVAYEGGQHITTNAGTASRNSQMYSFYTNYFNAFNGVYDTFIHFNHASPYDQYGAWGAKEGINQSISSAHKYRALVDWVNAHP